MKTIFKIIKGIITLFLLVVLVIVVFQKFTNNKVAVGNLYIFQVVSESMLPEYRIGDIIVVKKTNSKSLKIGDDVTYLGTVNSFDGLTITHRIVDIREENGERYFTTKGMSNYIVDPEISEDKIYGKVIYHTVLFSFVGRLMTNIVVYYLLFISVGVGFSYEVITSFFIKRDDDVDDTNSEDAIDNDANENVVISDNENDNKEEENIEITNDSENDNSQIKHDDGANEEDDNHQDDVDNTNSEDAIDNDANENVVIFDNENDNKEEENIEITNDSENDNSQEEEIIDSDSNKQNEKQVVTDIGGDKKDE